MDWGERRVGLAVSDPTETLASALTTLEVRGAAEAIARVAQSAREIEAEAIVVGLPLLLSGAHGQAAGQAQRFADALRTATGLPVELLDERMTSGLAQRRIDELGERGTRRKTRVDAGAAVALLETWLALRAGARARSREPRQDES